MNSAAPIPSAIPITSILKTFPSRSPDVKIQPRITKIMEITFLELIFSPKNMYAKIITKIDAEDKSTAAKDRGIFFIASL